MTETVHRISELVSDPAIHNGQPTIKNSQVRVIDVVLGHDPKDIQSPQKNAEQFGVHVGQIHAALAFYYTHKAEFDEQIKREQETGSND